MDTEEDETNPADKGLEEHERGNLAEAGDHLTVATYESLSQGFLNNRVVVWKGFQHLLHATLCYRIGGEELRSENRARQGILVAEDMLGREEEKKENPDDIEYPGFNSVKVGCCYEAIGEFRLVGNLGNEGEAYDKAEQWYSKEESEKYSLVDLDGHGMGHFEGFFNLVSSGLKDEERSKITWTDEDNTHADWLEYKRERLPGMIERLVKSGRWEL